MSVGTVLVGAAGALTVMAVVNILSGRKPWDISPVETRPKAALDTRIKKARIEHLGKGADEMTAWRIHDIRRTVATGMANIGVQPHIIEAVLNHISGHKAGVAQTRP